MIDLLFTFGAVAESKTLLPNRRFDDSQDCLTFLWVSGGWPRPTADQSALPGRQRAARPVAFALKGETDDQ